MTETHHHDPAASPGGGADRRSFFGWLSAGVLALAGALSGVISLLYLRPRVTFGSASKVQVGKPTAFAPGSVMEFPEERIVIRRDGDKVAAISTVCTHLGCTVKATEVGFDCPCHGSQYDEQGNVVGGPAPQALSWYRVALAPNGELEVNKQEVVPASTYLDLGMRV